MRRVLLQPVEIVLAEGLADRREDVHDVVVIADVVADRGEDEPSIATDELVPRFLAPTLSECDEPTLHERVVTAWEMETSGTPSNRAVNVRWGARPGKPAYVSDPNVQRTRRADLLAPRRLDATRVDAPSALSGSVDR
jgi:hypothetical protein